MGGDGWEGIDVPLGEEEERYDVDIIIDGNLVRTMSTSVPSATYGAADQVADSGGGGSSTLTVSVAQVSRAFGRGTSREAIIHV